MPDDNEKESTEQEQQERFEQCVPKDKQKTRKTRCKTPKDLVNFLMSFGSYNVYLTGARIKAKFPDLQMSIKRINEFMETAEFHAAAREQIPEINKRRDDGMFDCVYTQYFEGQMQLTRGGVLCPDAKSLTIFGQRSGKYDPAQKYEVSGGMTFTEEREKEFKQEIVRALGNRIARAKAEEGNGDG